MAYVFDELIVTFFEGFGFLDFSAFDKKTMVFFHPDTMAFCLLNFIGYCPFIFFSFYLIISDFRFLPADNLPVFLDRHSGLLFKDRTEIRRIMDADLLCNFIIFKIGLRDQFLCLIDPDFV